MSGKWKHVERSNDRYGVGKETNEKTATKMKGQRQGITENRHVINSGIRIVFSKWLENLKNQNK